MSHPVDRRISVTELANREVARSEALSPGPKAPKRGWCFDNVKWALIKGNFPADMSRATYAFHNALAAMMGFSDHQGTDGRFWMAPGLKPDDAYNYDRRDPVYKQHGGYPEVTAVEATALAAVPAGAHCSTKVYENRWGKWITMAQLTGRTASTPAVRLEGRQTEQQARARIPEAICLAIIETRMSDGDIGPRVKERAV